MNILLKVEAAVTGSTFMVVTDETVVKCKTVVMVVTSETVMTDKTG